MPGIVVDAAGADFVQRSSGRWVFESAIAEETLRTSPVANVAGVAQLLPTRHRLALIQ